MELRLISDTHGCRPKLQPADVLVHAGDLTMQGTKYQMLDALNWLKREAHEFKDIVLIAGNHDWFCQLYPEEWAELCAEAGFHYLNDSGVTLDGVKFWGSPIQPEFNNWAFNRKRGEEIRKHWDLIPEDTDVLITHGPPHGVLDRNHSGFKCGCEELRKVVEIIQPKIHVFGHVHEDYGKSWLYQCDTIFYNASYVDLCVMPRNHPHLVEVGLVQNEEEE